MKIFDISVALNPDLPVWPGDPKIELKRFRSISKGNPSNDTRLVCSVHSGTHVDAPVHMHEGGDSVDLLSLDVLVGSADVVEVLTDDVITAATLAALDLPIDCKRLLIKTPNSNLWHHTAHDFVKDFVALDAQAARWIVDRGIRLIGVDYLSVQRFEDKDSTTHRVLLEGGVIIVEGLNLNRITPGPYQLVCLPIKLSGSDGAPARAILIEE